MDTKRVRMWNLRLLEKHLGGRDALAAKLGYADKNYVNQLITAQGSFGSTVAKKITEKFGKSQLWLDIPRHEDWLALDERSYDLTEIEADQRTYDEVTLGAHAEIGSLVSLPTGNTVKKFSANLSASLEEGECNPKHEYVQSIEFWREDVAAEIRRMSVPSEWLEKNGYTANQIKTLVMPDNSQADLIRKGSQVDINTEWGGKLQNNRYYALAIGGEYTVKKVEILSTGDIVLRCRNVKFLDEPVPKGAVESLQILGEVTRATLDFLDLSALD